MPDRNDKPPSEPVDRHAAQRKAREERLAQALRANLKRRKTAGRPQVIGEAPTGPDEEPDGGEGSGA